MASAPTVLHVANFSSPTSGNFICALQSLNTALPEIGLRQVCLFLDRARERSWFDAFAAEIPTRTLPNTRSMLRDTRIICQAAREENAVILHAHFTGLDMPTWLAGRWLNLKRLRRASRPAIIWHHHSPHRADSAVQRLTDVVKYRFMGSTAHHLIVSQGGMENMIGRGLPPDRSRVLVNGIDRERATRVGQTPEQTRREVGIPEGRRVVLIFGSDPYLKGIDIAVEAFRHLPQDTVLLIVASEPREAFIRENYGPLPPTVYMARPRENVAEYYQAADIFITPSRQEGFVYAVPEATLNGLPVLASQIPGLLWARMLPSVQFIPPESVEALCEAIPRLLSLPADVRAARVNESREIVERQFLMDSWTQSVIQFYSGLLAPM